MSALLQEAQTAPWLPLPAPQPVTAAGQAAAAESLPRSFVTVLRYPSGDHGAAFWARMFALYAQYHRKLGFAATVVYLRDDMLAAFVRQPAAQDAIQAGALWVVRWDDVAPFPDDGLQVYDQV